MEIFWRLVLGHLIGDFTLQTNYIAAWKRRNLAGMLVHCGIHPILYTILTWRYLGQVWMEIGPLRLPGGLCIALIFVMHFVEDQWRVWSVLKQGAPDNLFFYLWDQFIHYAFLFALSPVVDGGDSTSKFGLVHYPMLQGIVSYSQAAGLPLWERFLTVSRPEPWVFVAILFVVVTHFTTINIYFIDRDFFGRDFPDDAEKYISMAERLAVTACFFLPGRWWVSALGVWLLWIFIAKVKKLYDYSWTSVWIGNGTAVLCGFFIRRILTVWF